MAMNKKERETLEAALTECALRRTAPVAPDVAPPKGNELSTGFLHVGGMSYGRIEPACSSSINHGRGQTNRTTSQGARWLYSTKLLALKALRYEVETECARKLRSIDREIEEEIAKGSP
jgi:hypothetical protein